MLRLNEKDLPTDFKENFWELDHDNIFIDFKTSPDKLSCKITFFDTANKELFSLTISSDDAYSLSHDILSFHNTAEYETMLDIWAEDAAISDLKILVD